MDRPLIRLAEANGIKTTGIHQWPEKVDEDVQKFVASNDAGAIFVVEEPDGLIIGPPPRSANPVRMLVVVKPKGILPEENWEKSVIATAMPLKEGSLFTHLHALLAQTVLPLFDSNPTSLGSQARRRIVEAERALEQLSRHTQIAFVDLENGALADRARQALENLEGEDSNSTVFVQNLNELQTVVNNWKQLVTHLVQSDRDVREGSASDEIGFWTALETALHTVIDQLASPSVKHVWEVLEENKRFHATRNFTGDTGLSEALVRVQGYTQILFRELHLGELLASVSTTRLIEATLDIFNHLTRKLRPSGYPTQRSIGLAEAIGRDFGAVLLKITSNRMEEIVDFDEYTQHNKLERVLHLVQNLRVMSESVNQVAETWDSVVREFATTVRDLMRKRAERFMIVKVNSNHLGLVNRVNAIAELAAKHGELWPLLDLDHAMRLEGSFTEIISSDLLTMDDSEWRSIEHRYAEEAQTAEIAIANELKSELNVAEQSGLPDQVLNVFIKHRPVLSRPQVRAVTHKYQSSLLESSKAELLSADKASKSLPEGDILQRVIRMQQLHLKIGEIRNQLSIVIGEDWRDHVEASHIGSICDTILNTLDPQTDIRIWTDNVTNGNDDGDEHILAIKNHEVVVSGTEPQDHHVVLRNLKALGYRFDVQLTNLADSTAERSIAKERISDCLGNISAVSETLNAYPRIQSINDVSKISQQVIEHIMNGLNRIIWASEEVVPFVTGFEQVTNALDTTVSRAAETDAVISDMMMEAEDENKQLDMISFKQKVIDVSGMLVSANYSAKVSQDVNSVLARRVSALLSKWQPGVQRTRLEFKNQIISMSPELFVCVQNWFDELNSLVSPLEMAHKDVSVVLEKSYSSALKRILSTWTDCKEELNHWLQSQVLWKLRKDQVLQMLLESSSSDDASLELWLQTLAQLQQCSLRTHLENSRLHLDTQEISMIIESKVEGWQSFLLENLSSVVMKRSTAFLEASRLKRRELEASRIDMRGVMLEGLQTMHDADLLCKSLKHWLPSLLQANVALSNSSLPSNWISAHILQAEYAALDSVRKRRANDLEAAKPTILKELESRTAASVTEMDQLFANWKANRPLQANVDPESALKALKSMSVQLQEHENELQGIDVAFKSLSYNTPQTLYTLLDRVQQCNVGVESLSLAWSDVYNGWQEVQKVGDIELFSATSELISKSFHSLRQFVEDVPERTLQIPAFKRLSDRIERLLSEALPNILTLKGSAAIKPHHISQLIPSISSRVAEKPLLKDVWLTLPPNNVVSDVVESAEGEFQLLNYIDAVRKKWDELILQGSDNAIRNLGYVLPLVNDHISAFSAMAGSIYYKAVSSIVRDWEQKLLTARQNFDLFAEVQQQNIYLKGVLTSPAVIAVLPNEARRFKGVNEEFIQLYLSAQQKPALDFAMIPRLGVNLSRLLNQFSSLNKSLAGFLEAQRRRFPRLYFVGDEKLLEIIGSPIQHWSFKHLSAIFPGVADVDLTKNIVFSLEKEQLSIEPLRSETSDNIELLLNLESAISSSLKQCIISAVSTLDRVWCNAEKFAQWIANSPVQSVLVALRVRWSKLCLIGNSNLDELNSQYTHLLQLLPSIGDGTLLWSRRKESIIAELIYEKHNMRPTYPQLLLGLRLTNGKVQAFCGSGEWEYGYEYLGVPEPIVRTSITDDLYLNAAAALSQDKGLSVVGPAGTGKTETVKSLGCFLGCRVVVFNCDDHFDHEAVLRILTGCGSTNSWACFDEFNRLNKSVLSSIAQVVNDSLQKTPIFVTMNPGYSGRTVLPPNMRDQFREFVLAAPDSKEIARVILFSHGQIAPEGAVKSVDLLGILQKRLSKQSHYDWGLRALKGIIRVAVLLNGDMKCACTTAIRPRLISQDVQVFDNEVERLFGDHDNQTDISSLARKASNAHLEVEEVFRDFIVSLEIFNKLFAGTMLLGPSGSGKTRVWKELARIYNAEAVVIDPSAVSKSALIGSMDPITREWTDGLLSSLFRRLSDNLRGEKSQNWFLVFDGEIEPSWAEALNSLLDDNRHLTLANGEILHLPPQLRIIFETTSLHAATPATVSRCGMICLPPYSGDESTSLTTFPSTVLDAAKQIDHAMEFIDVQAFHSESALSLGNKWLSMAWALAGDSNEAGRLAVSDAIRHVAPADAMLPSQGSLTDYYISEFTGKWINWSDSVGQTPTLESDAVNRPDLLIPTVDTVSHEAIVHAALASRRPLMLVGPPGSGKTMTLYSVLRQMPQISNLIPLNFSSNATSALIIQALELYCEYSIAGDGTKILAPSGSLWNVLFIDELNLPQPNEYDVIPVLQFIRHLIEYNGFFDAHGNFVRVEKLQLVCACNPPPLRREMSPSLLRHFISIQVGYPKREALATIYSAFLKSMDPKAVALVEPTLDVYENLPKLLPKETWTPRELTRWTRSIFASWNAISEAHRTENLLGKIWAYEAERVLCDRLHQSDKQLILGLIDQHIWSNSYVNGKEIWSHFMSQRPKFVYAKELKEFLKARISLFMDEAAGEGDNNLVVHDDFVDHVSRIDRIMRQPQGHVLLVGPSAIGKTTLVRFTCWLIGVCLDILRTHSSYSEADFSQDLRRVLLKALRRPTCLLLGDDLFSKPDFIELMNSLLANGEVPGLFSTPEQISELEESSRRAGFTGGDLVPWFRTQIVTNLHIVFVTSDISSASPALLNRCVVNRVEPWSIEVRREIAQHWCFSTDAPDAVIDLLASFFQTSYIDYGGISFIEGCRQFERAYNSLKTKLEDSQRHFLSGSDRIKSAVLEIGQMKKKLALRQKQLSEETEKSTSVLSKMLHEQSEAERKRVSAVQIRAAVKQQTEEIEIRRKDANEDLAATEPLISQAAKGVRDIKKAQLDELRTFNNPPEPVKMTLEAVCLVLRLRTDGSWKQVLHAVRGDEFIPRIVHFDSSMMTPELISFIEQEYMSRPAFNYERVDRASRACGPLLKWVVAQLAYGRAIAAVQPLLEEIDELNAEAQKSSAQLTAIEAMLAELEAAIEKSKTEYSKTVAQCESLKADMHKINSQLQRAESLMGSLVDEKERWTKSAAEFPTKASRLPQKALMEACQVAYGGKLDPSQLTDVRNQISMALPLETGDSIDVEDLDVNKIVELSGSVVLIIDPSDTWKPSNHGSQVKTTSFLLDSDTLSKELDSALRFGQHLVIQNAERFDSLLMPILNRDFVRRGARLLVKLGNEDIDVSPGFKLTLHARDITGVQQNAALLLPRVNVVDFSITQKKFEHIIANELLKAQIPELAERRSYLKDLQSSTTKRLNGLELKLLSLLSGSASEKMLDDQVLVESLETLKADTLKLSKTNASTKDTLAELEEASSKFEPSARYAAEIYGTVSSLTLLNKFYTIGVDWLCEQARACASTPDFKKNFRVAVTRRVHSVLQQRDWSSFPSTDSESQEPLPLLDIIKETSNKKPIIAGLATANATDPAELIKRGAADEANEHLNCAIVPMGSLQASQRADRVIAEAMEMGEWVVIQNVEVADDEWLRGLSRQMQIAKPKQNFRLILTGQQSDILEIPELVTSCRSVSVERERGVRHTLLSAITPSSDNIDFAVCYLHASFAERFDRIHYSPSDLTAARWFAREWIGELPTLRQALLICVWGARTGDQRDKAMIKAFIDRNLQDPAFPKDFRAWAHKLPAEIDWLPELLTT